MAYCSKGRVCITLKKTSQLKTDVDVTIKEDFDFAEALESVYPLLEIVFSYLDYSDLQKASMVKKSWQVTAGRILEKRNKISWITVFRKKRQSYVHYSNNYLYNNVNLGIILFNYRAVSLNDFFCCHENLSSRKIRFSDFLSDQVVPSGTEYCAIGCPGVASMFSKQVVNKSSVPLFDGCFIPPIPNVRVSMFYCNPVCRNDDHFLADEKVKCILFFSQVDFAQEFYDMLDHLISEEECDKVAIAGGIVRRTTVFPQLPEYHTLRRLNSLCIAFAEEGFCDNSVFDASSVVINGNNLTSEDFEDHLLKFKRRIVLRSNSLAFRICCSAKMRKNHESRIFNKVFPDTPLIGLEAEGEIGWNCFNHSDNNEEVENKAKKCKEGYPIVQHQWSTVIALVTWGHLIHNTSRDL